MENQTERSSNIKNDLKTMGLVLGFILILNLIDTVVPLSHIAYMTSVLTSTSVILFIVAASHLMRRLFFPNISMTELVTEAKSHPIGAAVCFFGICIILAALIVANVTLLL